MGIQSLLLKSCVIVVMLTGSGLAADVRAGLAEVDITPPVGWRLSGYFAERVSTGTHDPLKAKAIVLAQADTRAAIVACDLIGVPAEVTRRARQLIADKIGIPRENVAVVGTHTHTGPLYFGAMRQHLHDVAVAKHGRDPCETIDFPSVLAERIADAVVRAEKASVPARLTAGVAPQEPPLSFNRRFHMKDGTVRFNPPPEPAENILRPAGPVDPDVSWLMLAAADTGRPLGSLTSFALHLDTTGGVQFSADYPYYLESALRSRLGPEFISVFGTGTCGDVNHVERLKAAERRNAEAIGRALARTLESMQPRLKTIDASLAVKTATVVAPLQHYSPEQIRKAAEDMHKIGKRVLPFLDEVEAYKITDLQSRGDHLPLEVQVMRIGADTAIVFLPGEIFVEIGLAIKRNSPFKHTFVIELANDNPAYIPTAKAFGEGSYEIVNSRVQPGTGEKLAEAAVRLLAEVRP